jgi:hypothetical protein
MPCGIFMAIWYIINGFGMFYVEKSGSPDIDMHLRMSMEEEAERQRGGGVRMS